MYTIKVEYKYGKEIKSDTNENVLKWAWENIPPRFVLKLSETCCVVYPIKSIIKITIWNKS